MNKIYSLLLILITSFSYSQEHSFSSNSYKVTGNDLETNTFKKDSTANALVIYEFGNSYIDKSSFYLKHEFKQKLKILNRKGFDNATITIYLYNSGSKKEKISKILATTHNLVDGKVVKTELKKSDIYTEKYNDNYTLVKFTLPNIQEGSVISYSYKLTSPFIYKYKSWSFQSETPKLYSEYNTSIPANYEYHIKLVGSIPLTKNLVTKEHNCLEGGRGTFADCLNSIYVMENIPAFIDEDYMTTRENYLSRIEYELSVFKGFDGTVDNITKRWRDVDKEIKNDANIGKQYLKKVSSKSLLSSELINETDPLIKATKIYEYVQNNYTWNKKYNIFNDISVKKLIKEKSGNVSEINALLHNLLKDNDIQVNPILISTRNNGLPTKIYPVISDFNYILIQATIDGKEYLLDATDPFLSFGQIPFRCLNQYGRILDFKTISLW
ncbi:MAG: DUF3857 domain-containing protein, partial [Oceanihabitans sp.]